MLAPDAPVPVDDCVTSKESASLQTKDAPSRIPLLVMLPTHSVQILLQLLHPGDHGHDHCQLLGVLVFKQLQHECQPEVRHLLPVLSADCSTTCEAVAAQAS